ncbi:hypothetical protein MVEG_01313 [Podila verticillata NRRL 6337]|nr:hypothetical protein MVEG_01313 [Podila verticillata NRRL 6337]
MSLSDDADPTIFQNFVSEDYKPLKSLPTYVSEDNGNRYILWTDIQLAFKNIDSLKDERESRVMFVVDDGGTLRFPLCIEYDEDAYHVIIRDHPGFQVDESLHHIRLTEGHARSTVAKKQKSTKADQGVIQESLDNEAVLHLDYLLRSLKIMNMELQNKTYLDKIKFQRLLVNTLYYFSQILEQLKEFERRGVRVEVDGMAEEQLHTHLNDLRQETLLAEYKNNSCTLLDHTSSHFEYPAPKLFLVLPDELNSWVESDPTTHSFRLYFICDISKRGEVLEPNYGEAHPESLAEELSHQHVHLCNHPGYILKRPQEFFQAYGDYVLRVLQLIEHGYSDNFYDVPPLNTFKILWGCDALVFGSQVSKDTIRSLVAKAISYLQDLSLQKWILEPALTRTHSALIRTFLDVQDEDDAKGNLHRYISPTKNTGNSPRDHAGQHVFWKCQVHSQLRIHQPTLEELRVFLQSRGGHIDMEQAELKVELSSATDADQFCSLLMGTKHTFNISIKLNWKATRPTVVNLCKKIASTLTVALKLDGITVDIHPPGHVQYPCDLFSSDILPPSDLISITLLNYPRSLEHRFYVNGASFQATPSPGGNDFKWWKVNRVARRLSDRRLPMLDYKEVMATMEATLASHGFSGATVVTIDSNQWSYAIDLKEHDFLEVYSKDMKGHDSILSSGSVRRLTVDLEDQHVGKELSRVVQANPRLQELNISYSGHDELYTIENIVRMWQDSSSSSCLTLFDRLKDVQGRIMAQLALRPETYLSKTRDTLCDEEGPPVNQQQRSFPEDVEFLQWNCDQIAYQQSDYSASFLERATRQHRSELTMFTLDISRLSRQGLGSVQKVLGRSSLEYLHVVCTDIDATLSDSVAKVLASVQWSTLKSLKLSGNQINAWIRVWMSPHGNTFIPSATNGGPQLLHLHVQGIGSSPELLSHTSALFVHGLVYWSPSVEVHLTNVILEEDFVDK